MAQFLSGRRVEWTIFLQLLLKLMGATENARPENGAR